MSYFLYVLWLLSWIVAFLLFGGAKSAMHETTAALIGIHGTACLVAALVVGYLKEISDGQAKAAKAAQALADAQPPKGRFVNLEAR